VNRSGEMLGTRNEGGGGLGRLEERTGN